MGKAIVLLPYHMNSPSTSPSGRCQKLLTYVCCFILAMATICEGGVYFAWSFRLCGYYSRMATIQGW